jgi:hypothetical protein
VASISGITSITEAPWDPKLCTSCDSSSDKNTFALVYANAQAGSCLKYQHFPQVRCAKLNTNAVGTVTDDDVVCTKVVQAEDAIYTANMPADHQSYFSEVNGPKGFFVAFCNIFKETTCEKLAGQTSCKVKKAITCAKVCKGTNSHPTTYQATKNFADLSIGSCSTTLCEGAKGATACNTAAMMS